MNVYLLVIICTMITFLATVLGSLFVFLIRKMNKNIEKVIMDTWKYKVFRIDTLNDLICVYVVDMEETL